MKYSVHINKPSARAYKTSMIVEADSPEAARNVAEQKHGEGSVIRVVHMPEKKR